MEWISFFLSQKSSSQNSKKITTHTNMSYDVQFFYLFRKMSEKKNDLYATIIWTNSFHLIKDP